MGRFSVNSCTLIKWICKKSAMKKLVGYCSMEILPFVNQDRSIESQTITNSTDYSLLLPMRSTHSDEEEITFIRLNEVFFPGC